MEQKFLKRGFNFTEELLAEWARFHAPSKDYSPSAAAAFLLYMVVEPSLREDLRKLALKKDIPKARIEARKLLRETIINAYWTGFIGLQSIEDKKILLEHFVQTEKGKEIIDTPAVKKPVSKKIMQKIIEAIKKTAPKEDIGSIIEILSSDKQALARSIRDALWP